MKKRITSALTGVADISLEGNQTIVFETKDGEQFKIKIPTPDLIYIGNEPPTEDTEYELWIDTSDEEDISLDTSLLKKETGASISVIDLMKKIYPIGSLYINTIDTNPSEIFGFGSWERVSKNMTLWGAAKDNEVNAYIAAGIPDITGQITNQYIIAKKDKTDATGMFDGPAVDYVGNYGLNYSSDEWGIGLSLKASKGETKMDGNLKNDVYGKSNTVQPPAMVVNIWKRIS